MNLLRKQSRLEVAQKRMNDRQKIRGLIECFSKFKYDTSKLVTFLTNHNRKDFSLLFEADIYFAKLFSTFVSTKI
jgi:hypothetical protein